MRTTQGEAARPQVEESGGTAVTRTTITRDALQSSNAQNTYDAIKDVPGVALAEARAGTADSLQIRGIKLSATTSYRLDGGLPLTNTINLPIEDKARVEVLKGAGALQFGVASPAGIINYVMKRATDTPITSFSLTANEYGQMISALDVGRRFGEGNQLGVRVNLAGGDIGSSVRGAGGIRYVGALAADWNVNDRLKIIFDYERLGVDVIEQGALLLNPAVNNRILLPRVPKNTRLLSGPWARAIGEGENIFARATYDIGAGFSVIGEAGSSTAYRPIRAPAQVSNYNIFTGLGRGSVTLVENQLYTNYYANLAVRNQFEWEFVKNDLTVGVTHNERLFNNPNNPAIAYAQNIYAPFPVAAPYAPRGRILYPNNSYNSDIYFQDQLTLFRDLHLLGGVRQISYTSETARRPISGVPFVSGFNITETTAYAPAAGLVLDLGPKTSIYASYVSSLEETGQATVQAANAYSVLPPAPATQYEVGIRGEFWGTVASVGFFKINRANATIDPTTRIFGLNGTIDYDGIEYTIARPLTSELSFNTGGQILKATQISPNDRTIDGKTPENTPFFSGTAGLVYRPDWLKGLTINGGLQYIGERQVNAQNQAMLPSTLLFNAGASYVTRLYDRRVVFNMNVRNLTGERYFNSAVNGFLGIASPRTVTVSARVDF